MRFVQQCVVFLLFPWLFSTNGILWFGHGCGSPDFMFQLEANLDILVYVWCIWIWPLLKSCFCYCLVLSICQILLWWQFRLLFMQFLFHCSGLTILQLLKPTFLTLKEERSDGMMSRFLDGVINPHIIFILDGNLRLAKNGSWKRVNQVLKILTRGRTHGCL